MHDFSRGGGELRILVTNGSCLIDVKQTALFNGDFKVNQLLY